jgi:hypothetical protein
MTGLKMAAVRRLRGRGVLPVGEALAVLATCAAAEWWSYPEAERIEVSETSGDPLKIRVDNSHRLPLAYVPVRLREITVDVIRTSGEHLIME